MPKKINKNGGGKLTKQQERELAQLDAMPEPVTEMAKTMRANRRKLILSGEHHRSEHIIREIRERR